MFIEGDIIIKQGYMNSNFYYIHEGMWEVILETKDFMFFNYKEVQNFISKSDKNGKSEFDDSSESNASSKIKNHSSMRDIRVPSSMKNLARVAFRPKSKLSGKLQK